MLKLYDVVKTKRDYPEYELKTIHKGAIVDVINDGEAYTVEFIDENGDTIESALYTEFQENELELINTID